MRHELKLKELLYYCLNPRSDNMEIINLCERFNIYLEKKISRLLRSGARMSLNTRICMIFKKGEIRDAEQLWCL